MTVYLNGKKVSKSRQRSLIGWTDYRCPVKDCFTIIINNSPTAKYKVSAHKRKHTMEAMKKPQYKIGDYVEFECKEIYFNGKVTIENKKGFIYFIDHESKIGWSIFKIKTRSGKYYWTSKIIRKLPINRDKNGRFACKEYSKEEEMLYTNNPPFGSWGSLEQKTFAEAKRKLEKSVDAYKKKQDCSCFNCDKCAEQMRAYYEKTGELKAKTTNKTEEKKPSDRIDEIYRRIEPMFSDNRIAMIAAIGDYLDEQFEKNQ